jgi:hypothetical protein
MRNARFETNTFQTVGHQQEKPSLVVENCAHSLVSGGMAMMSKRKSAMTRNRSSILQNNNI